MKKLLIAVMLVLSLGLFLVPPVLADTGQPPVGACPSGFHPHGFHGEDMEHHDHHVGLEKDLNGNLTICVKHLTSGKHVHVDDVIPAP